MTTNVTLGNNFTPSLSPQVISRFLSRLPVVSLTNLCILWSQLKQTQPKATREQQRDLGLTTESLIEDFQKFLQKFKRSKNGTKRRLIDRILVDYYRNGLNLLQFAQLDSQLMIEKPLNFIWQASKIYNSIHNSEEIINLSNPQMFLNQLLNQLSKFYLNHIYISDHPHYPLLIIRIQLFDLISDGSAAELRQFTTSNSIISRRPIFIALPINSSTLIHSYQQPQTQDLTLDIVLQCFEYALSITLDKQLKVGIDRDEPPIRSLESLHILKGNSRFAESLGPWAPYADGSIDISPFDDVKNHDTFQQSNSQQITTNERRRRIAMLRFKGTLNGLISEKLFEDVTNKSRKRRKLDHSEIEETENDSFENSIVEKNEYSSITPIQYTQFEIRNQYEGIKPKVKIRFSGKDVFGGLHELCDLGIMDPETLPGWLTGQESESSNGIIEDHIFFPRKEESRSTLI